MGTFKIIPYDFIIKSGPWLNTTASGVYDNDLLAGILNPTIDPWPTTYPYGINGFVPSGTPTVPNIENLLRLRYAFNQNIISLDGGPLGTINGLPSGFKVTAATISLRTDNNGSDAVNHFRVQFDQTVESGDLLFGLRSFAHPTPLPHTALFWFRGLGIRALNHIVGEATSRFIYALSITGVYEIEAYSWTMNPPNLSGILAGDLITITSDDLLLNDLDITIGGIPIVPIIDDPYIVTFIVPSGLPEGPVLIDAIDPSGTQFSGTLTLGVLIVLGADVSGIYVLENAKKNDTLYNSERDGSTVNRAIPNPFIETGFVGG